jgi:hypothetical protein
MIKRIEIYRSGSAVWVVIDGQPLPADWIDEVAVEVNADEDDADVVLIRLRADSVMVDAGPLQLDAPVQGVGNRVPEFA